MNRGKTENLENLEEEGRKRNTERERERERERMYISRIYDWIEW